jgi:RNA-directed DNA polymerase
VTISALRRLLTPSNLRQCWQSFWREAAKQRSSGVDWITPADFHVHAERNLARLFQDLQSGYKFALLRAHPVPKKDGKGFRIICVPTVQDRIVQRLLARHLLEMSDKLGIINEASFGFLPSSDGRPRGVIAARNRAIELRGIHRWAYKSDISSFFDRIPRDELVRQTIAALRTPSLKDLAGC